MAFCGTCPHCRKFYAHNFGEGLKHAPKCKLHLFCKDICPKGRKQFIADLGAAVASELRKARRGDLGAAILSVLKVSR